MIRKARAKEAIRSGRKEVASTLPCDHRKKIAQDSDKFIQQASGWSMKIGSSIEDQAKGHFHLQWIRQGHMSFLETLANNGDFKPALESAILSIGMLALASNYGTRKDTQAARQQYGKALRTANTCLSEKSKALDDQTVAAVYLLYQFEFMDCDTYDRLFTDYRHVSGAIRLLWLRDKDQLNTKTGMAIFQNVRALAILHCVWTETEVPAHLYWIKEYEHLQHPQEKPYSQLLDIGAAIAKYRAAIRKKTLVDPLIIVAIGDLLDNRLATWELETLGIPGWRYTLIQDMEANQADVWNNTRHEYCNQLSAVAWSAFSAMGLAVCRISSQHMALTQADNAQAMAEMTDRRLELIDHICSAVPFRLKSTGPPGQSHVPMIKYVKRLDPCNEG